MFEHNEIYEYQEKGIQASAQRFVAEHRVPAEPPKRVKVRGKWITYTDEEIQKERERRSSHNRSVSKEANKTIRQRRAAAMQNNFTLECLGGGGGTRYIGSDVPVYGSEHPPSRIKGLIEMIFIFISATILAVGFVLIVAALLFF